MPLQAYLHVTVTAPCTLSESNQAQPGKLASKVTRGMFLPHNPLKQVATCSGIYTMELCPHMLSSTVWSYFVSMVYLTSLPPTQAEPGCRPAKAPRTARHHQIAEFPLWYMVHTSNVFSFSDSYMQTECKLKAAL